MVHTLTGDYPAATASHQRGPGTSPRRGPPDGRGHALINQAPVQQLSGHYAAASQQNALALFCDLGELHGQAYAHNDLGIVQQLTGDYPTAAASHQRALALFSELGNRLGRAEAHNNLGQLAIRTANTAHAHRHHAQALATARDISAPLEEARALEGLGQAHLQDGSHDKGLELLHQAHTIYQRIGAPAAQRVQEALQNHRLTSTTRTPATDSKQQRPRLARPVAPKDP